MADLTTYAGLKDAIADYLGRGDMTERIPTFIKLAEMRLNRELRMRVMERRATTDIVGGQKMVPLPWKRVAGDWDVFMEMRDLSFLPTGGSGGKIVNLVYMPPDRAQLESSVSGCPAQYTILGRELLLIPCPDGAGTLTMAYYAEIPPLSDEQVTNDVLLTAPDVYLYASLVESGSFTRGSAPVAEWAQYLEAAKENIRKQENRARYTANITMRPTRRI